MDDLCSELDARRAGSVAGFAADLADAAALPGLVADVMACFGRLDGLVNNASAFYPTPLGEAAPEQWDELMAVNARAPFLLAQAAAEPLRQQCGGIVNIVDIYAERPRADLPAYAASKAALVSLTRSLALALAPEVRVNAVAPGAILWPDGSSDDAAQAAMLAATPLARMGTVADIADAVQWLLLRARFTTGQVVNVDGGRGVAG